MFEISLERLKPGTILVAIGKPFSVLAAIRMTNDHHKLGRVVVVPRFEFQPIRRRVQNTTAWVTPRSKAAPTADPVPWPLWGNSRVRRRRN
jgi:hypothetical protein